jgi:hypothetical protein
VSTSDKVTLLEVCDDADLFAPWFKDRATWNAWFAFIAALFALPMSDAQIETFRQCTGRSVPPTSPANEAWLVCGRRAGKSFMLALVAVFLATFRDYRQYLAPGERATIMIIALWRPLCRRVATRALPQARHRVHRHRQGQVEGLRRGFVAAQFRPL